MKTSSIHCMRQGACAAGLFLSVVAASAGDAGPSAAPAKNAAVRLEPISGSSVKRITLAPKAVARLDIQLGKVSEEVVIRRQTVGGMVIYPRSSPTRPAPGGKGYGGFESAAVGAGFIKPVAAAYSAAAAAPGPSASASAPGGESWVVVNLSPGEFERIAKDKPARITPLYTRDKGMKEMLAPLSADPPVEDGKRSMLVLHYVLPTSDHGLAPSTRVRVELQLAGSEDKQKVVPYDAVYYDSKGLPWVYVNTGGTTYERRRIAVQHVVGPMAVLSDGPAVGTPVVTVGAALLYGTEIFGK